MKIYLVGDGKYSDYHIEGVYSTMEKALEAKAQFNTDQDIEEMELDEMPEHPPGMFRWGVAMNLDGSLVDVRYSGNPYRVSAPSQYDLEHDYSPIQEYGRFDDFHPRTDHVVFYLWARDEEHAIKIANERRTQLIARNEWTDDYRAWDDRLNGEDRAHPGLPLPQLPKYETKEEMLARKAKDHERLGIKA